MRDEGDDNFPWVLVNVVNDTVIAYAIPVSLFFAPKQFDVRAVKRIRFQGFEAFIEFFREFWRTILVEFQGMGYQDNLKPIHVLLFSS